MKKDLRLMLQLSKDSGDTFNMEALIPDVIVTAPAETAVIKYGDLSVNVGNELTPTQVKDQPTDIQWSADPQAYYTLLMTDPDIPPQVGFKQIQHWLVINIPGKDVSKGETLLSYVGSGPRQGSGIHRYAFAIYKQSGKIEKSAISDIQDKSIADRAKVAADIVQKLNLGNPVAANYYRAQYDDYVPILHETIAKKYSQSG